jgi:hypothetical protein
MSDDDLEKGIRDVYRSVTPPDSLRVTRRVEVALSNARGPYRMWQRSWLRAAAVIGICVVAGALVAPRFIPSTPGTAVGPSVPAAESPTATVGASLSAAPASEGTATPGQTWKTLASSDVAGASWSPDGTWLAVWDSVTNGTPDQRHLRLFDKAGKEVRALDGDQLVWLDSSRFVASKSTEPGRASLGSADSASATAVSADFSDALTNNHGAVALISLGPDQAKTSFVVWTPSGTSQAITGEAAAWSADGTRLAVWHYTTPPGPGVGAQPSGRVEVLSWPGLSRIASTDVAAGRSPIVFDPSGRYLAVANSSGHQVLDLSNDRMIGPSGASIGDSPVWDRNSKLIVPAGDGTGLVTSYPIAAGGPPVGHAALGDRAASSADGSAILYYFSQREGPVTLIRDGMTRAIEVPGPVQPYQPDPQISANGDVVLVCLVGQNLQVMLLVG